MVLASSLSCLAALVTGTALLFWRRQGKQHLSSNPKDMDGLCENGADASEGNQVSDEFAIDCEIVADMHCSGSVDLWSEYEPDDKDSPASHKRSTTESTVDTHTSLCELDPSTPEASTSSNLEEQTSVEMSPESSAVVPFDVFTVEPLHCSLVPDRLVPDSPAQLDHFTVEPLNESLVPDRLVPDCPVQLDQFIVAEDNSANAFDPPSRQRLNFLKFHDLQALHGHCSNHPNANTVQMSAKRLEPRKLFWELPRNDMETQGDTSVSFLAPLPFPDGMRESSLHSSGHLSSAHDQSIHSLPLTPSGAGPHSIKIDL